MKKILVLTDFSGNAAHAAKTAIMLASRLNGNLLLLNCFVSKPVLAEYEDGGAWMAEEYAELSDQSRDNLKDLEKELESYEAVLPQAGHHPSIHFQAIEGKLGDSVKRIQQEKDIELVIMGGRSGGTIEHLLGGGETSAVIKKSGRPVLIVPESAELKQLKRVTLAVDFSNQDINAVHYLTKLGHTFGFQLHIVHINRYKHPTPPEKKTAFIKQLIRVKYPFVSFEEIKGKDVVNRLNQFCVANRDDMLAIVHYPAPFLSWFNRSGTTKKALAHQTIPLLVIPSVIDDKIEQ